jgi:prepilin-type N-terminal cleavage/methylation domain-containing protein
MNNRKGMTLIEVLASITILALAVIAAVYALQQTSAFSRGNQIKEVNVQVARTVMEEIKANLKKSAPVTVLLYGQTVDISGLKAATPAALPEFYSADQAVKIAVSGQKPAQSVAVKGASYAVGDYFRLITVICTDVSTGKAYTLQAYVESN